MGLVVMMVMMKPPRRGWKWRRIKPSALLRKRCKRRRANRRMWWWRLFPSDLAVRRRRLRLPNECPFQEIIDLRFPPPREDSMEKYRQPLATREGDRPPKSALPSPWPVGPCTKSPSPFAGDPVKSRPHHPRWRPIDRQHSRSSLSALEPPPPRRRARCPWKPTATVVEVRATVVVVAASKTPTRGQRERPKSCPNIIPCNSYPRLPPWTVPMMMMMMMS
mmetsp:Transcript_7865/g.16397  ORF Transcript_7865/g.16397 Transcript_7865/m.16397 type:complete len:220 (+) Transcript_7865:1268-1927(+)